MKNSSQTQHHRSETKRKEEQKIEEIRKKRGCRMQEAGSQWNSSRMSENSEFRRDCENFAILAKFSLCENFARLAKFC